MTLIRTFFLVERERGRERERGGIVMHAMLTTVYMILVYSLTQEGDHNVQY